MSEVGSNVASNLIRGCRPPTVINLDLNFRYSAQFVVHEAAS